MSKRRLNANYCQLSVSFELTRGMVYTLPWTLIEIHFSSSWSGKMAMISSESLTRHMWSNLKPCLVKCRSRKNGVSLSTCSSWLSKMRTASSQSQSFSHTQFGSSTTNLRTEHRSPERSSTIQLFRFLTVPLLYSSAWQTNFGVENLR